MANEAGFADQTLTTDDPVFADLAALMEWAKLEAQAICFAAACVSDPDRAKRIYSAGLDRIGRVSAAHAHLPRATRQENRND